MRPARPGLGPGPGIALFLSLCGGAALAEDAIPADVPQCLGAYGALADQAQALSAWSSALGRSNVTRIDWAARRAALLEAEDQGTGIYTGAGGIYLTAYKMRMAADRINSTAADTSAILELSIRCDQRFHYSPSFAIPAAR